MFLGEKVLVVILLLLPTQLGRHFWPSDAFLFGLKVDYLSPVFYLQDIFIIALIFLWVKENKIKYFSGKTVVSFVFFLLLAVLNIIFSLKPLVAFVAWLRFSELLLLGYIVSKKAKTVFALLDNIFPCLIVFEFILGTFQVLKQSSLNGVFWLLGERSFNILTPGIARASWLGTVFLRPYGTFSHPNSLAGFILVCLIFVFAKKNLRPFDKLSVVCGFFLIFLAFSRTIWLVLFLLGLAFFLFKIREGILKKELKLSFSYLSIVFMLPVILYFFSQTTIEAQSFSVRKDLAGLALRILRTNPLFGVGANNFIVSLAEENNVWQWLYWLQPVHNIFLLIGTETGLIGLFIFTCFILLTIDRLLSGYDAYLKPLFVSLLCILFSGLFDHYWLTLIQNQLLFAVVLGLSWGLKNDKIAK